MPKTESTMLDQAAGLREMANAKPVQVIAVTAGKGGVGKTNVSVNLALSLAKRGKKVLVLDADLGLANVDVMLGLHAKHNISHVLDGSCSINDIVLEGPAGIKIIPASSGTEQMTQLSSMEHAGIINAFNEITGVLDYLIVDTAAGISDTVMSFARSSNEILVVVCDEPTSLTDAYAFIKVMSKRFQRSRFHVLANMVRKAKDGVDLFNKLYRVTEQFLDVNLDYLGAIPFDELVHKSVKMQRAVVDAYPGSPSAHEYKKLVDKIYRWSIDTNIGGNTTFFIERLAVNSGINGTDKNI